MQIGGSEGPRLLLFHASMWCQNNGRRITQGEPSDWPVQHRSCTGHFCPQIHTRDIVTYAQPPLYGDLVSANAFHVLNREVLDRK